MNSIIRAMTDKQERTLKLIAVIAAVCLWQMAAMIVNNDMLLCSPIDVIKRLPAVIAEKDFVKVVSFSFIRISVGFLAAFILSVSLGIIAGKCRAVEIFLQPYMTVIRTVPVASFIILALFVFSGKRLSSFISFLIALPVLYGNVLQGIKSIDKGLIEMADIFCVPLIRRVLYLSIPAIEPYLKASAKTTLGLCWKAGIAAEVIAVSRGSIGEKLYESKLFFSISDLLVWTLVLVVVSILYEKFFLFVLSKLFLQLYKN